MITVRLKDAIAAYERRTGERLTYAALAERTGIARATIESLATRAEYNSSLKTIEKICEALDCAPGELLDFRKREPMKKRRGKRS